jgi:membrane-associated protease RseP (regulator of RpoE activity)
MGATTRDPDIYILVESGTPPCQRTVAVWAAHGWWSRGVAATVGEMRRASMLLLAVAACAPQPAAPVHPAAPDHELHVSLVTQGNALHATIVGHEVALERLPIADLLSLPMWGRGEIRPSSLYARLGLLNGDTLVSVNGFELTSADKALEIYTKLREASRIEIVVERKGVQLTLAYSIR